MIIGCAQPSPSPSSIDRVIRAGTCVARGNSEYAVPAMSSAAPTTVHSLRRRATTGIPRRTRKVASAKVLMTMPMTEGDSPMLVP